MYMYSTCTYCRSERLISFNVEHTHTHVEHWGVLTSAISVVGCSLFSSELGTRKNTHLSRPRRPWSFNLEHTLHIPATLLLFI